MDEIRLTYGRVGELYSGNIWIQVSPTRGLSPRGDFESISFPRMMARLAEIIREHKDVNVILYRTEVSGSSYQLEKQTVDLLRTDPAAAISSMILEPRTIVIRSPPASATLPSGLLRAGHDTIAESFGDSIYCAADQESRVECPGCGRWSGASPHWLTCTNAECLVRLAGKMTGKLWFVVDTTALIGLGLEKYYLPRSWNPRCGWISRGDLQITYENFQLEREKCFQQIGRKE